MSSFFCACPPSVEGCQCVVRPVAHLGVCQIPCHVCTIRHGASAQLRIGELPRRPGSRPSAARVGAALRPPHPTALRTGLPALLRTDDVRRVVGCGSLLAVGSRPPRRPGGSRSRSAAPAEAGRRRGAELRAALDSARRRGRATAFDHLLASSRSAVLGDVVLPPARARRALGAGRGLGRAGALRVEAPARPACSGSRAAGIAAAAPRGARLLPGEQHDSVSSRSGSRSGSTAGGSSSSAATPDHNMCRRWPVASPLVASWSRWHEALRRGGGPRRAQRRTARWRSIGAGVQRRRRAGARLLEDSVAAAERVAGTGLRSSPFRAWALLVTWAGGRYARPVRGPTSRSTAIAATKELGSPLELRGLRPFGRG